jgi:AbrB family looped-hinge helix DNA binding protein
MRDVITLSGGKITIPKKMRDEYGLEEGDKLIIKDDDGKFVIKALSLRNGERDFGEVER